MKLRIEFKLADLWIGVFWKRTVIRQVCHFGDYMDTHSGFEGHCPTEMTQPDLLDIWICLIPCFPIHLMMEVNGAQPDRLHMLAVAGALIAAEIDRINRSTKG